MPTSGLAYVVYSVALWSVFAALLLGLVTALVGMRLENERVERAGWYGVGGFMVGWTLIQLIYRVGPLATFLRLGTRHIN
jgi:hypothetical protein